MMRPLWLMLRLLDHHNRPEDSYTKVNVCSKIFNDSSAHFETPIRHGQAQVDKPKNNIIRMANRVDDKTDQ